MSTKGHWSSLLYYIEPNQSRKPQGRLSSGQSFLQRCSLFSARDTTLPSLSSLRNCTAMVFNPYLSNKDARQPTIDSSTSFLGNWRGEFELLPVSSSKGLFSHQKSPTYGQQLWRGLLRVPASFFFSDWDSWCSIYAGFIGGLSRKFVVNMGS